MRRGFTILEALVAAAILGVGCLGVLGMLITTVENNRSSRMRTEAIILAEQQLADLEATSLSGSPNENDLFKEIQTYSAGVGWTLWKKVDARGITNEDGTDNLYTIAFLRLAPVMNIAPSEEYIRGAIRVVWSKNGTSNETCSNIQKFSSFDKYDERITEVNQCDFITMPYAFRIP